ncbi:alanine racemase [Lentilactobacillus sp. SPB1-3]|uniref:Alanine racemase n=1 Tax=Lentilactobacillus terminaliae TaxID=3003483 RepID=A0ACD5DGL9_9LACO|nr:alanine racemase [Lentilactobacillus sp. SPB1-3]MCZ0977917.1 alanine racemase [Lentilactobacillus sp. SPB1-3]
MVVAMMRNSQVLIDQQAIFSNIKNARENLEADSDLFVVLKADGYGHGAVQVAKIAQSAGATGFCVAMLDEAMELREAGIILPILVLGITDAQWAPVAADNNISLTISSSDWLKQAAEVLFVTKASTKLKIHVALDTGMGRIGFQTPQELAEALTTLKSLSKNIEFEGIFTHFATADEKKDDYFQQQYDKFNAFMEVVSDRPKYVHVANSATSLWHKICGGNMIRLGIAAYGLNPSQREITELPYDLKPALTLTSSLVHVKMVTKGTHIGYGATYEAQKDEWIGTVPMGYADGIARKLQGFDVLVNGHKCEIVGRVCMDQFMIRLDRKYDVGTSVVIIGKSGELQNTAEDIADYIGTINYEVICGLQPRIKRVYF